jgi:hypothetical protein
MTVHALEMRLASIPNGEGRLKALVKWASTLTDDAIDALGGQAAVVPQVEALYDQYIAKIDIPTIPNLLEPMVDEAIKKLIVSLVWAVDDEG